MTSENETREISSERKNVRMASEISEYGLHKGTRGK